MIAKDVHPGAGHLRLHGGREDRAGASEALSFVLEHLNSEDRFNIVAFSTGVTAVRRQPAARPREADEAVEWVRRLEAVGGTDINRALLEALAQADARAARPW